VSCSAVTMTAGQKHARDGRWKTYVSHCKPTCRSRRSSGATSPNRQPTQTPSTTSGDITFHEYASEWFKCRCSGELGERPPAEGTREHGAAFDALLASARSTLYGPATQPPISAHRRAHPHKHRPRGSPLPRSEMADVQGSLEMELARLELATSWVRSRRSPN
jgi:hypothetical protein